MLDFVLHIDKHIAELIKQHGAMTYVFLGLIVFCETGLVVTPFLPGDSLLFAAGLFCIAKQEAGSLNVYVAFATFMIAALCGDNLNYLIGRSFGKKLFKHENSKIFKKSNLDKTHEFFDKHGKSTIILARFVPIVRTFAPFVAGMGEMPYRIFLMFSVVGAFLWVGIFLAAGYFLGQIPAVKDNFEIAVIAMVAVTGVPLIWEVIKARRENRNKAK